MPLSRGERGPKGDHGQTGDVGDTGDRGRPGAPGPRGVLSTAQGLAMFLVIVVGVLVITYRTTESVKTTAGAVYEQCLISAANAEALNEVLDTIILRLEKQPPSAERDQGLVLYENAKPKVPDCGEKP